MPGITHDSSAHLDITIFGVVDLKNGNMFGVEMTREDKIKKSRSDRNKLLVDKLKNNESFCLVSLQDTWWPPRPIIKKDKTTFKAVFRHKSHLTVVE